MPAPVSEKKVLKASSPPPMVLSEGIWPSGCGAGKVGRARCAEVKVSSCPGQRGHAPGPRGRSRSRGFSRRRARRAEGEGRVGRGWVWAVRVTHLDTVLKAVELPAGVTDLCSRGPASVHPSFALHSSGIQKQSTGHLGWGEGRAGHARGGSGRARGAGRGLAARARTWIPACPMWMEMTSRMATGGLVARRRRRRRKVSKDAVRGRADSERPRGPRGGYIDFIRHVSSFVTYRVGRIFQKKFFGAAGRKGNPRPRPRPRPRRRRRRRRRARGSRWAETRRGRRPTTRRGRRPRRPRRGPTPRPEHARAKATAGRVK